VTEARAGRSRVLVLRGEAGIGKSALLDYVSDSAAGCRVARASGVESEMELAFAGLHQLCAPMLAGLDRLPAPQRDALATAFGLSRGAAPDRFLVGLAVLTLLTDIAERQPLVCIVDDVQWLDQASAQTLAFGARRLLSEPVALILATRPAEQYWLGGLPDLPVGGLADTDARALLMAALHAPLDVRVRDRIVAESRGNPLALLELPRAWSATQLAGGFGLPDAVPLTNDVELAYLRRVQSLPTDAQRLVLAAAAEPLGDVTLVRRALELLGVEADAAAPAEAAGLIEFGARVRFRHRLVRSAAYRSASAQDRQTVHSALAQVTDRELEPDRRAWHLANATSGPDEDIAAELERSAGRARARGGLPAAAAFLDRAAALTLDPARHLERLLAAAQLHVQVGAFDAALRLLAAAETGTLDELACARVALLRGRVAAASSVGDEAPAQLLRAARRLDTLDVRLAREAYLDAWGAALSAGRLAAGGDLRDVSRAARAAARPPCPSEPADLLLDGVATLMTEGRRAAAVLTLRRAVRAFRGEAVSLAKGLQWAVIASSAAATLWDVESWDAVITRQVEMSRGAGALPQLAIALNGQGIVVAWSGDLDAAAAVTAEAEAVTEATGTRIALGGAMLLAALRGDEREAVALIESGIKDAMARGEGLGVQYAHWASAVLYNGLGRYQDALAAARRASEDTPQQFLSAWALPELIEASVRSGRARLASDALERLADATRGVDADWGAGIEARSRALLSEGKVADSLYREAIDRLGRTRLRPELARAHLLYGEWLRRANHRLDSRRELHTAHELFAAMGVGGFAERSRRELLASGETVRKRTVETVNELTMQEYQIARLARDGLSNPEIGSRLFISARTVEWHLRKVFTKLGISSRKQIRGALPHAGQAASSA
jgi:DNA-binding CsgD family transcriptional regulator